MEFLKDRASVYVNLGFINEEQKEKIVRYELNHLIERDVPL
jgi:MoxR-like ATPase